MWACERKQKLDSLPQRRVLNTQIHNTLTHIGHNDVHRALETTSVNHKKIRKSTMHNPISPPTYPIGLTQDDCKVDSWFGFHICNEIDETLVESSLKRPHQRHVTVCCLVGVFPLFCFSFPLAECMCVIFVFMSFLLLQLASRSPPHSASYFPFGDNDDDDVNNNNKNSTAPMETVSNC